MSGTDNNPAPHIVSVIVEDAPYVASGAGTAPLPLVYGPFLMYIFNRFRVGAVILVVAIFALAVMFGPLTAAKVLVALIFASLALVCLAVVVFRDWLLLNLKEVEEIGYFFDEMTKHDAGQARIALEMLNERLDASIHPVEAAAIPELLRNIGPLVRLLIKKETSTMSWVMFGAKLAKNAFDVFKQRKLI